MTQQISVVWQAFDPKCPAIGYDDMAMIEGALLRSMWNPVSGHQFIYRQGFKELPPEESGAVMVLSGRNTAAYVDQINREMERLKWALLILSGDEESAFPVEQITHNRCKIWIQTPVPGRHDSRGRLFPIGYTYNAPRMLPQYKLNADNRFYDWFFSGQLNHPRRAECIGQLQQMQGGDLNVTKGFYQGFHPQQYYEHMANAKVVPCPSGPWTPDSFRVHESLQAGCVPIVDGSSPRPNYPNGYWDRVFQNIPFPVIEDWRDLPRVMGDVLNEWPTKANHCAAWWMNYKREFAYNLDADISELIGESPVQSEWKDKVSILVPTSPVPCHPDTTSLEATIQSIRHWFKDSEIFIMFDGVRDQVKHRIDQYEEYKRRVIWKCQNEWTNILPVVFQSHHQQNGMTRETLKQVKTPFVLFMEHDTILTDDLTTHWDEIFDILQNGNANIVRFYYLPAIHHEHRSMMHGELLQNNVRFIKTTQYSQWPHVASTQFYRKMMREECEEPTPNMIETVMYGPVAGNPWDKYRVVIYHPDGMSIRRFIHNNARGDDPKEW